ncbi:MAG: HNH endonuclease [Actinomycetia bacterium]|nr:HNH endonuclease [Actinomycetes bacterium]
MNPFPPGSYVVDEARSVFDEFVTDASGRDAGEQLVAMRQVIDRLEGLWLAAAADFSESGELAESGHPTLASWMRHRCNLAPGEASARSRVAFAVTESQPATGKAVREGSLSWRHAQVIGNALREVPADRRDEAELALVAEGAHLDPGQLRQVATRLVHCFDRERADEAAVRRLDRRGLSVAETMDGMVSVSGLLDPVTGALLMTALNCKLRPTPVTDRGDGHGERSHDVTGGGGQGDELRTWSQRRADALAEICQEWLQGINETTVGGVRPHLSVIVDHATLAASRERRQGAENGAPIEPAQLAWIGPITATEAQMIGCDSTVSRIVTDGPSQILDVGRATRTIPPALRRAVSSRDRSCIGPGCHRPPEHCDVHHIVFWEHGGETSLDNTVLLCRRHHGMVHLKRWKVVVEPDGTRRLAPP